MPPQMKALEYEAVRQSDSCEDGAGQQPTKKSHRILFPTAVHLLHRHQQASLVAAILLAFGLVMIITMYGPRRSDESKRDQQMEPDVLYATPELITTQHGAISPTFFATVSQQDDVSCAAIIVEGKQNGYGCISDRLQYNEVMSPGTVLCSEGGRFMFGLLENKLVWKDCRDGSERAYYRCPTSRDCTFVLTQDSTFQVRVGSLPSGNMGEIVYEKTSRVNVAVSNNCLAEPRYDCPYLSVSEDL